MIRVIIEPAVVGAVVEYIKPMVPKILDEFFVLYEELGGEEVSASLYSFRELASLHPAPTFPHVPPTFPPPSSHLPSTLPPLPLHRID